jgi:hypothetical protein
VNDIQRRLAAILVADVVGYSRLMSQDDKGTLKALNERRKLVRSGRRFTPLVGLPDDAPAVKGGRMRQKCGHC